ncbi:hypothetical protein, partial [Kitasatospora cystarginea]|uniref:hypothetical protein n=1 Tax=Kitasatospora cystarginea TaxID=58350 RepID=UPI0031DFAC13
DEGGPAGGTSTEVCGWTEFEVELEHGPPTLLDHIEAVFADAGLTRSPWPSPGPGPSLWQRISSRTVASSRSTGPPSWR